MEGKNIMDYLEEGMKKMRRVSSGEARARDAELQTMLLAGIGQQLKRIADVLDSAETLKPS